MKRKFSLKIIILLTIICVTVALTIVHMNKSNVKQTSSNVKKEEITLSSWVTYWDNKKAVDELSKMDKNLKSISVFAASFNDKGNIYILNKNDELLQHMNAYCKNNECKLFLTVVNDYVDSNGKASMKDAKILRKLLLTEESRVAHIEELVQFALDGGYRGIEIDYENIKNDDELWKNFIKFSEELYPKAKEKNLELRIILEPAAPIEKYKFPKGPAYIMMAYNLYGLNTKPGPKADIDFINKLCEKTNKLEGEKSIAFATGGFDWVQGEKTTSLTNSKIEKLLSSYKHSEILIDKDSGSKHFTYVDSKGANHTVWYADEETFKLWISTGKEKGFNKFAIWRLEENSSKFIKNILKEET